MERIITINNIKKQFKAYENKDPNSFFQLRRRYFMKQALKGVSFSVNKGEIVALLGKNGSGKSTLIKILCGILHPDSGSVDILGFMPWEERIKLAPHIGVVLGAHGQLYWDLPAIDTFNLMRHIYKIPEDVFNRRLESFLDILELRDVYKRQVRTLSLGEQMKCNFVASVLHNPPLVILDEPTIGVDLPSKQALRSTILDMKKDDQTTFLLTTHIVDDITMAERIIALDKGTLIFDGSRRKLETLFGNKKIVEIEFSEAPDYRDYVTCGKVIKLEGNYLEMEVRPKVLTSKAFIKLLSNKNVTDYKVGEQDLSEIIMKLYKLGERKGG